MNLSLLDPFQTDFPEVIEEYLDDGPCRCLAFNRRGTLLAAGCLDGSCLVWDFETRGVAKVLSDPEICSAPITSVCWSKCGRKLLAAASTQSRVVLWDVMSGKVESHTDVPKHVLAARLNPKFASICVVCPVASPPLLLDFREPDAQIPVPLGSAESPATGGTGRSNGSKGPLGGSKKGKGGSGAGGAGASGANGTVSSSLPIPSVFHRDGDLLLVGTAMGKVLLVRCCNSQSGRLLKTPLVVATIGVPGGACIKQVVLSRDCRFILVNSADRVLRVFTLELTRRARVEARGEGAGEAGQEKREGRDALAQAVLQNRGTEQNDEADCEMEDRTDTGHCQGAAPDGAPAGQSSEASAKQQEPEDCAGPGPGSSRPEGGGAPKDAADRTNGGGGEASLQEPKHGAVSETHPDKAGQVGGQANRSNGDERGLSSDGLACKTLEALDSKQDGSVEGDEDGVAGAEKDGGCDISASWRMSKEFQDPVTRVQWRSACFSGDGEFVMAGAASKGEHKLHIWNREFGQLCRILQGPAHHEGPSVVEVQWHPVRKIAASVAASGVVYIWAQDYRESWSAFAPDFRELEENEEYVEREDEFDLNPPEDDPKTADDAGAAAPADEEVDIEEIERIAAYSDSDESEDQLLFLPVSPEPDVALVEEAGPTGPQGGVQHDKRRLGQEAKQGRPEEDGRQAEEDGLVEDEAAQDDPGSDDDTGPGKRRKRRLSEKGLSLEAEKNASKRKPGDSARASRRASKDKNRVKLELEDTKIDGVEELDAKKEPEGEQSAEIVADV